MTLYYIGLFIVSSFHILVGLGNLFKLPPLYDSSNILVNEKPGAGSTEVEKLLELITGSWYTASIIAVFLSAFWGPTAIMGALAGPLVYHVTFAIAAFLCFDKYKIPNQAKVTGTSAGVTHAVLAGITAYVLYMS